MNRRLIVAAIAASVLTGVHGQLNSPFSDGYLERAAKMYTDGNYNGCLDQLTKVDPQVLPLNDITRLAFYRAAATVHTDKALANTLLTQFVNDNSWSDLYYDALMCLGDCYYGSDYAKALDIYNDVDTGALTLSSTDDLNYRKAYCYMMLDDYDNALALFNRLDKSPTYANAAKFYRGYIAYVNQDYRNAQQLLGSVKTNTPPGDMADYYLAQIDYIKGNYANALELAKRVMIQKSAKPEFTAEAYRIAGESEYNMGNRRQAIVYLKGYKQLTDNPMPTALYVLGLDDYDNGDYAAAIENLKPATRYDDAMGQSAYLYLGLSYMHMREYDSAAMAFNRALNMAYDPDVRETAYYNYGVATMNGGKVPFASTAAIFTEFLDLYPDSRYAPQVQDYIVTAYISDDNYAAALSSINRMSKPSAVTLGAKQRVLYVLGAKVLTSADYKQALQYLTEARSLSRYDANIDAEVSLLLGEAYYRNGNYSDAVRELQKYLSKAPTKAENRPLAHYDLGYVYMSQNNYKNAAAQFEDVVRNRGNLGITTITDAYNRLGDCHYYTKNFDKAAEAYDNAYRTNPAMGDYALFQKALMAGYQRNHTDKVDQLSRLRREYPTSTLIPDALLETTEAYIQMGNTSKAVETYRELIDKYSNTPQGRQGYLQLATVLYNSGNRKDAINNFREVVRMYPSSDEAKQATEQLKRIAAEDGTLSELTAFLRSVSGAPQIDATEIESLTYDEAEKQYLTTGSITRLRDFVDDYPDSNNRPRAMFYLVEANYMRGDNEIAAGYADAMISQYPEYSRIVEVMVIKADIEEKRGNHTAATDAWKQVAQSSTSPAQVLDANMGIMRNGRQAHRFDDVMNAADAVSASAKAGANQLAEAAYSRGMMLMERGNTRDARRQWQDAAKNMDNRYGTESAFWLAQSYYDTKDYNEAESWAEKVIQSPADFPYWTARAFVLLSDVYKAQGNDYKARQYLEALRDNYNGPEQDIQDMINSRLKK